MLVADIAMWEMLHEHADAVQSLSKETGIGYNLVLTPSIIVDSKGASL